MISPRRLTLGHLAEIDRLHARCAELWELIEGAVPSELPPGVAPEAKHVEELARTRGGTAMRLAVQQQNPRALAFWARRGFVVEATGTQQVGRPNLISRLVKRLR